MNLDPEPIGGVGTIEEDETARLPDDPERCEFIDGHWVPKHPDSPPEPDRTGCELIDGVWAEKPMSNLAGIVEAIVLRRVGDHVSSHRPGCC